MRLGVCNVLNLRMKKVLQTLLMTMYLQPIYYKLRMASSGGKFPK